MPCLVAYFKKIISTLFKYLAVFFVIWLNSFPANAKSDNDHDDNHESTPKTSNNGNNDSGGVSKNNVASHFNCIEQGAAATKANIKQLYTKVAGRNFSLDIVALDNKGKINDKYRKTVQVEIINQRDGETIARNFSFEFKRGDKGRKAFQVNLNKAYRNLICKVSYQSSKRNKSRKDKRDNGRPETGGEIITELSDNFSVRPLSFSSIRSSMNNPTSAAGVTAKAGTELFSITASTGVTSYTGTPKYNSLLKDHNDNNQENKLSGNFSAANEPSLNARGTNFKYREVGLLKFAVNDIYDDNFTAIDQANDCTNDFSNVLVNGKYGCKFGNANEFVIGRFVPDHFTLLSSSITPACHGFTYMDQNFSVSYTIEARNGLGEVTRNYHYSSSNNYAKTSEIAFVAESSSPSKDLSIRLSTLYDATLWVNGRYQANNSDILFSRATVADGAYDGLNLGLKVVDTDAVLLADLDMLAADNSNANCAPAACLEKKLGATKIRFGRLTMDNAHGSELIALSSPVYTEYFNGSSFVTNTEDSCTAINLSQFSFNGSVNPIVVASGHSTASIVNTPISAGQIDLALTAPGTGNTGAIDINVNSLFEWLKFDWDGNGSNDFPTARATFGIYKGNQQQIYFREVY